MLLSEVKDTPEAKALDAFMQELWSSTTAHPFVRRMRIWNDSVGIEVSPFNSSAHVSSIMSFYKKNSGEASGALKWLTALADKHKVRMELSVKPIKNAGAEKGKNLTKAQLFAWYGRNGFKKTGQDDMERLPR